MYSLIQLVCRSAVEFTTITSNSKNPIKEYHCFEKDTIADCQRELTDCQHLSGTGVFNVMNLLTIRRAPVQTAGQRRREHRAAPLVYFKESSHPNNAS